MALGLLSHRAPLWTLAAAISALATGLESPGLPNPHQDDDTRFFHGRQVCARCHDASAGSVALKAVDGTDVSPVGTLAGTMMQAAFADPFFRAQLARERTLAEDAEEVESTCLRCHAPVAFHEHVFAGQAPLTLHDAEADPFASEGVSCTVCHRIGPDGLGSESTFSGNLPFSMEARLFGPYPNPNPGPMRVNTGYEVTYGPHMVGSNLCATCHTLETSHGEGSFLEQAAYLEWRNSVYSYETDGVTDETRSCQSCHMQDVGSMRIAHNPGGRDFGFTRERPEVRSHRIVGGNARVLDLLGKHGEQLGAPGTAADYERTARATREQLRGRTAQLEVVPVEAEEGIAAFDVLVTNLTGHKLPTGFPSRRVWLEVSIEGETEWFVTGRPDREGRILPPGQGLLEPHHTTISSSDQVQVWEHVAADGKGQPTTAVTAMATSLKDNRLLPRGWEADGPDAERTRPKGVGDDPDFAGGGDRVSFRVPIPSGEEGRQRIQARLWFQTMPPTWLDDLDATRSAEESRLLEMVGTSPSKGEVLAEARRGLR